MSCQWSHITILRAPCRHTILPVPQVSSSPPGILCQQKHEPLDKANLGPLSAGTSLVGDWALIGLDTMTPSCCYCLVTWLSSPA